jgi:hypothetical protein
MEKVIKKKENKKEGGKAARLQKIRKQGQKTSQVREKNSDLLFGERSIK